MNIYKRETQSLYTQLKPFNIITFGQGIRDQMNDNNERWVLYFLISGKWDQ